MIYLLHFNRPHKHAKHYLGYCSERGLKKRLERHRSGRGAKLLLAVVQTGNDFTLARTWPGGTRDQERRLKNGKRGPRLCPICNPHLKCKRPTARLLLATAPTATAPALSTS